MLIIYEKSLFLFFSSNGYENIRCMSSPVTSYSEVALCTLIDMSLFRVIPPEQQAEADELAAALSELQAATMHEWQEVVGGVQAVNQNSLLLRGHSSDINVSPFRMLGMIASQSGKLS